MPDPYPVFENTISDLSLMPAPFENSYNVACGYLFQTYLLPKLAVPEDQIVVINPSLPVEEAAADYAAKLKEVWLEQGVSQAV